MKPLILTSWSGAHNPIHRWWGGTELTSERLWRWDRAGGVPML
jgi:hypothetical protein